MRPACLPPDRHGTPRGFLAGREASASVLQSAEIVVQRRNLGTVRSKLTFQDRERPPVEPLGLIEIRGVLVNHTEVVANARDLDGVGPGCGFREQERLPIERLSLDILSL